MNFQTVKIFFTVTLLILVMYTTKYLFFTFSTISFLFMIFLFLLLSEIGPFVFLSHAKRLKQGKELAEDVRKLLAPKKYHADIMLVKGKTLYFFQPDGISFSLIEEVLVCKRCYLQTELGILG